MKNRSIRAAISVAVISMSMPAFAWWNTGVVDVVNNSSRQISVNFLEVTNGGLRSSAAQPVNPFVLPPGARVKVGWVVPWCDNIEELRSKAIVVSAGASRRAPAGELFRICQNYRDNIVYYVRGASSGWEDRVRCASGAFPYVSIAVDANELPVCKG